MMGFAGIADKVVRPRSTVDLHVEPHLKTGANEFSHTSPVLKVALGFARLDFGHSFARQRICYRRPSKWLCYLFQAFAASMAALTPLQAPRPTLSSPAMKSTSNVRVVARIRPLAAYEIANGSIPVIQTLPSSNTTSESNDDDIIYVEQNSNGDSTRWFQLDAVLDQDATQRHVYERSGARRAVTVDLLQGFNCTILAYGQTGAGKSYSMGSAASSDVAAATVNEEASGVKDVDGASKTNTDETACTTSSPLTKDCGVIPRACFDLFETIRTRCKGQATVELSYLEVYNEEIRDLLSSNKTSSTNAQLRIREHPNGDVYVRGLEARTVTSSSDVGRLMQEASSRRVTASTNMNATSSRSHAICVLRIQGIVVEHGDNMAATAAGTQFQAKLTLVDLAGSERFKKTGAQGDRAQEGISINKGLFVLGQVISALSEQRPNMKRKPPYRDSKLTRLLQDSLGGNSRTIMIACVSPADFNIEESINTLRYATSARNIKNTATRNVTQAMSAEAAAKLTRENKLLKQEVRELQQTIQRMSEEFETRELLSSPSREEAKEEVLVEEENEIVYVEEASRRISELEEQVAHLHQALDETKRELRASMAASAVVLPALKVKVALLEDELNESRLLEEEAENVRHDYDELKSEATAARTAARRLSHIVQDMSQRSLSASDGNICETGEDSSSSIGTEIQDENAIRANLEKVASNEAWVGFIVTIYSFFKEDMRVLGDQFSKVTKIAVTDDNAQSSVTITERQQKSWWKPKKENDEDRAKGNVSEFLEIEDQIESRFEALLSVADSVEKEREELKKKLSLAEVIDVGKNSRSDVLLKWLRLTLGMTTKANGMDEDDGNDDNSSLDLKNGSMGKPFTLFDDSNHSMDFDDSVSDAFQCHTQLGMLGERAEELDSSDNDDLLY
ncbi:hypothetical protein MPSEU_000322600 [Mayamaea pseudoterrestris]|nr:hypothetical protein MPSEU_000322600 [Mayamaea pseudoterrestris]